MRRLTGRFGVWDVTDRILGSGGESVVYECAQENRAYKEYGEPVSGADQIAQLWLLVDRGRQVIARGEPTGKTPETSVNWPVDGIEGPGGRIIGVVLPRIPRRFLRDSGRELRLDWLLLPRAGPPPAAVRLGVLIRLAEVFAFLDDAELTHGDLSARNVTWCGEPEPGVYILDCDRLRNRAINPVHGVATPDWMDPRLAERLIPYHDHYSDRYALALAMYRGLLLNQGNLARPAGSRAWPKPAALPAALPTPIKALFDRALGRPLDAAGRPSADEWVSVLTSAYISHGRYDARKVKVLNAHADVNRREHERRRLGSALPSHRASTSAPRPGAAPVARPAAPPQSLTRPAGKPRAKPGRRRWPLRMLVAGLGAAIAYSGIGLLLPALSQPPAISIDAPMGVAAAPDGKHVYVTGDSTSLSVVDPVAGRVTATVPLRCGPQADSARSLETTMAVAATSRHAYVANRCQDPDEGGIHIIDLKTGKPTGAVHVPAPMDMMLSRDGKRLYATSYAGQGSRLVVLDTRRRTVTKKIALPYAYHVAVTPDGHRAYVAKWTGSGPSTVVVDLRTGKVSGVKTAERGITEGLAMGRNGEHVYIGGTANGVIVVSTKRNRQVASIAVDGMTGLAMAPDGKRLYALIGGAHGDGAGIRVIDTRKREIVATVPVPDPRHAAVSPDNRRLYVATDYGLVVIDTGAVAVIDPAGSD